MTFPTIVVQLPADTREDVEQFVNELAQGLDSGEYGATVTAVDALLAAQINRRLNTFVPPARLRLSSALAAADLCVLNAVEVQDISFHPQGVGAPQKLVLQLADDTEVQAFDQHITLGAPMAGLASVQVIEEIAPEVVKSRPVLLEFRMYRPLSPEDVVAWEEANPELVTSFE